MPIEVITLARNIFSFFSEYFIARKQYVLGNRLCLYKALSLLPQLNPLHMCASECVCMLEFVFCPCLVVGPCFQRLFYSATSLEYYSSGTAIPNPERQFYLYSTPGLVELNCGKLFCSRIHRKE